MFKNINAIATGTNQNQTSRVIADPDALTFDDTPSSLLSVGITGTVTVPEGYTTVTGSSQSVEFDGTDDYMKLTPAAGSTSALASEILLEDMGDEAEGVKHGSTATNIAFETWLKIDSALTGIDEPSQYFENTIQRNALSAASGYDGIYGCRCIYATSAMDSDPSSPGYNASISAHFVEFTYAGERMSTVAPDDGSRAIFEYSLSSACSLPLNEWHHIWCEHTVTGNIDGAGERLSDSAAHDFKIYRNGILDRHQCGAVLLAKADKTGSSEFPSTGSRGNYWFDNPVSFDGRLDELRIWSQSATLASISNIATATACGLKPEEFPLDQEASPSPTANSVSVQFSPSADFMVGWWRLESLSAVYIFAGKADLITDYGPYGLSGTPVNFAGSVDFSEEDTITQGELFTDFWHLSGGTLDHGGLMVVHDKNDSVLLDEGIANLVVSASNTWNPINVSNNGTGINQDNLNIFYGTSAVKINTNGAGDGVVHNIDYGNLFFDKNKYTVSLRGILTSGSPSARVTFTIGHNTNSIATTAVWHKTAWVPTILTKTVSADFREVEANLPITGSVKVEQLYNASSDSEAAGAGSLFNIDGLAIQEGDYDSTFIGPDRIRKSGQVSWRVLD